MAVTLTSEWLGLNKHLIASFFEVDRDGKRKPGADITVEAPLIDGNFEATFNWQGPFENVGPETNAPTVSAVFQSGEGKDTINAITGGIDKATGGAFNLQSQANESLTALEGKTGITKLNSVQIFTGMQPIKIPITVLFRAWKDASKEVEKPFDQLMKWSLPIELAGKGLLSRLADEGDERNILYPSTSPTLVGMKYKNRLYAPMVIESIGYPIISPIEKNGRFTELSVQLTLATLAAVDRKDWDNISRG